MCFRIYFYNPENPRLTFRRALRHILKRPEINNMRVRLDHVYPGMWLYCDKAQMFNGFMERCRGDAFITNHSLETVEQLDVHLDSLLLSG